MELEEMKALWADLSQNVEQQKILTDKLINDMTQERYNNRFNKLQMYETIGSVICFAGALFLILNLEKLDAWYLMAFGIITLLILLVVPILTLRNINKIKNLNITNRSYKEVLVRFHQSKKELLITQKLNFYLCIVLAITILPVTSKIFSNTDLFESEQNYALWIFIPILLIISYLVSRWGLKCYKSIANSAENIIQGLDN